MIFITAHADRDTAIVVLIEERTVRPVRADRGIPVDMRIVAATNRSLGTEVAAGRFREDLYYRLKVLTLCLPALREDHPALVDHFVHALAQEMGVSPPHIREVDLLCLTDYSWPGNVRGLRNVIERRLLLWQGPASASAALGGRPTRAMTTG